MKLGAPQSGQAALGCAARQPVAHANEQLFRAHAGEIAAGNADVGQLTGSHHASFACQRDCSVSE